MQPNTITLSVDKTNAGSPTNVVYNRLEELVNRSTYGGEAHTFSTVDTMQLYRTLPVRSGSFLGSAKTSVKFTKAIVVPSATGEDTTYPAIGEISFSLPVGATAAMVKELRQTMLSVLDRDDIMDALNNQGVI